MRKNARGTTRTLSFRDIAHLIVVGEEDVITERSPVLSGQRMDKTVEISVFRMLLTALDDSSLVEQDEPKVARGKQQGKKELLKELLAKNEQETKDLSLEEISAESIEGLLKQAEMAVEEVNAVLTTERESASTLEEERQSAWQALRQVESRAAVVLELQHRFELLQEQYSSDLRRLEAIGEAGVRLAQITEERCPICGAIAEHHDEQHRRAYAHPEDVAVACGAEAEKLQLLVRDLSVTIATNSRDLENLDEKSELHRAQFQVAQSTLRQEMQPRIAALVSQLQEADQQRVHFATLAALYSRRDELSAMLEEAEKPIPRAAKLPSATVGADVAEEFSKVAEGLLRAWNLPNLDRVTFSEDDQDLVISGRKRSSHGKGVRALTHAGFSLAMLQYCRRNGRPHPGLVVIDSPLVVYREPDSLEGGEEFKVKDTFYHNVAVEFATDQVIVFENEPPPVDLADANVVFFTKADHGRTGFLPRRAAS